MIGPGPRSAPASPPTRAAVIGIAVAAGLVPLNSTMIAVALPDIADDFGASAGRVSVLVTVYLLAMLVGQPVAGRVVDRLGSRSTVTAALLGISLTSLLAGASPNLTLLVAARGLQAVFAAALVPGVQSMLRAASPPAERGRTFGILGSVIAVGAAAGPIVGGAAIEVAGWPAMFLVNIPIAAAALLALRRTDPGPAPEADDPTTSVAHGMVANPVFVASFAAQALSTQGQYALLLLAPVLLAAQGWGAGTTGLALSALTIGMIVTGPPGGRWGDRRGRRAPVVGGLAVAAAAIAVVAAGAPSIAPIVLVGALAVFGLGIGFSVPSMMTAALESVREERTASAAGVFATSRYVGSITASIAIAALVTGEAAGSRVVLVGATATMVLACLVAGRLPGPAASTAGPHGPSAEAVQP